VYLYHGVSFTLRQEIVPPVGVRAFGTAVASLGDIDGDGFIDFAVGAPGLGNSKGGPPGEALVYSGQEGRLLYRLPGIAPADDFGRTLASPGDFTGDGLYDLVVGAPLCCDPDDLSGRVSFYDGKSGELLRRLDPVNGFLFGLQMDEFGDLDGNGQVDALVRMERFGGVSGLAIDGHSQETFRAYDVGFTALAADGYDWNDDGFPDYLLGDLGGIELFSGAPPRTEVLGEPCGTLLGRAPRIGATRAPVIGEPYLVHLSEVPPGVTAILRLGALGKPSLLPTGGQRGCAFTGSTMAEIKVRTQKLGPGRGAATVEFPIPADPALLDQSFSVQWTVLGLRGIPAAHTRVLRPRIGQ
jgi:hypothetical protein